MSDLGRSITVAGGPYYGEDDELGFARLYEWVGSDWVQLGEDIIGEELADYNGFSVSLNSVGDKVAVGAKHNSGNGAGSGHVRVFSFGVNEIEEVAHFGTMDVHPNPSSSGHVSLAWEQAVAGSVLVQLYGLDGGLVMDWALYRGEGLQTLDLQLNAIANGVYVFEVHAPGGSYREQFVKVEF